MVLSYKFGQLGDNTTENKHTPVQVDGLSKIKDLMLGRTQTCALSNENGIHCWGKNNAGQITDASAAVKSRLVL
ncbi:MAG: hypothetical protein RLZZ69_3939 [Cyanobacteriota bacterium]